MLNKKWNSKTSQIRNYLVKASEESNEGDCSVLLYSTPNGFSTPRFDLSGGFHGPSVAL